MHCGIRIWVIFIIIALWASLIRAQTSAGTISGVVQDTSGAVVPGVQITITNVDTGITRSTVSDEAGRYEAPGLIPGRYEIRGQITGFQTAIRQGIELNVGSQISIALTLTVGQVTETAVVTAEAPIVETSSSSVGALVSGIAVRDLPLNGRSFDQLISLESSAPTFRAYNPNLSVGMSATFNVNGARPTSNLYLMDGIELVGAGISTTGPGGVLGKNMGVDAVQEFKIMSANYSAAYGKRMGGVINIATRNGTNEFHGSVYEFLRNSALDARNFFDPGKDPAPFKRNQFGGTLGGPLRKDKAFFFSNYEGLRDRLGLSNIAVVPDENARRGLLPDPARTGEFLNVGVASRVQPYLNLWPRVNGRNFADGTGEFLSSPSQPSNQDFFMGRIDYNISAKDSLLGRYSYSRADQRVPNPLITFAKAADNHDQFLTLEEKRIFSPATLNSVRFGFSRGHNTETNLPLIQVDPSLYFYPQANTLGAISFASLGGGGSGVSIAANGISIANQRFYVLNQFDISDQIYHQRGPHALTIGVQLQRIQSNHTFEFYKGGGAFSFASLANFLAGTPSTFQGVDPNGGNNGVKGYRWTYFSSFLQDDYKVRPNLTLNLGVRYELMTVPTEANGRISNYRPIFGNGLLQLETTSHVGDPFINGNHKLFAPRVGLAWDVFGNGKTALRSGFGMFFDQLQTVFQYLTAQNPPFVDTKQISNPPFPLGFSGTGPAALPTVEGIDPNLKTPTRLEYSLSIQQQISTNTAFTIGYVGAHSYHMTRYTDANGAVPQLLPDGSPGCSTSPCVFYPPGLARRNPALGAAQVALSDGNAIYHGLQTDFTKRFSHGVQTKVSFTFSKNIDDSSNIDSGFSLANVITPQNALTTRGERALSIYDVRRNFVTNLTYELPFARISPGRILSGWRLGGIVTLSDGSPFTALIGFNRAPDLARNQAQRPNLAPGASNNPLRGGPDRYFDPAAFVLAPAGFYGNVGRNTLIGPGYANVDATLEKSTTVKENVKIDFRAEFFNVLNHANFGVPNRTIFNTNGSIQGSVGRITKTVSTSRQIQFGMKISF